VVLFNGLLNEEVETYGLVLSSSGILYHTRKRHGGWDLLVESSKYECALEAIEQYLLENKESRPDPGHREQVYQKGFSGIWAGIILLIFHVVITTSCDSQKVIREYGSSARHILQGEVYRCATSLMIHGDTAHLVSNMLGIAVFGTAVCSITGLGAGWFMILVAGMAGNMLNAVLYGTDHLSIGASTAIFGAIGIMAACQSMLKILLAGPRIKAFIPFGAGLALLGFLGSSSHTDLTAHLFGFLAGAVLGVIYGIFTGQSLTKNKQAALILVSLVLASLVLAVLAILTMSWLQAR
jgi:membrane associated rhomboid family serine protease